ncbi:heme NO-binding domain-containing protein [uncultured Pelagimonas sp.]|uniref:heme NO-binding domain-containing protein n=1 Tax=uncultured Pelagimonas sp. TaxID=1618102 RepID=UPI0026141D66|nr:heme NO-binding domain-containing protein [uncultured Pelagimonas sp.]
MKGMVFTELLDMAEQALGEDVVDQILDDLALESDGSYTSVGNYPCRELMQIVGAISDRSGASIEELQRQFGAWMLKRFSQGYPEFFAGKTNVLDMLDAIENEVHVEVRKLYPDAELPKFDTRRPDAISLEMTYQSERPLVPFCRGLIEECITHFGDPAEVTVDDQSANGTGRAVFLVRLAA